MAYRIIDSGIWVLKAGGDSAVEADWTMILSFEGATATVAAKAKIGPGATPTIFSADASGTPQMAATDSSGTTLPVLRQQSGTVMVNASKDVLIAFEQPFAKVPRVTVILDQSATTQPWRIAVTKTEANLKMANPYTGSVDFVAIEPSEAIV